eukprot:COSAG02_NODE_2503_length_8671_cov_20.133108_3_plen_65_part_00
MHDGETVLDVGITHPTIDTYINNSSSGAASGSAANIYANNKCRSARPSPSLPLGVLGDKLIFRD